eukprot:gene30291-36603_t
MWFWTPIHKSANLFRKRPKKHQSESDDGFFLSKPKTEHLDLENRVFPNGIEAGHASMQGYRVSMEDRHVIAACDVEDHVLVAIFDGHAGILTADHAAARLQETLQRTAQWR